MVRSILSKLWLFSSVVLVLLLVALSGCGSPSGPAPATSKPAAPNATQAPSSSEPSAKAKTSGPLAKSEAAMYQGADRAERLLAGAKSEGKLISYTSMPVDNAQKMADAFEKKYGVKVEVWRSKDDDILTKAKAESQASKVNADVFETADFSLVILDKEKLITPFLTPVSKEYSQKDSAAQSWYATRLNLFCLAYNTKLIKKEDLPKTYDDLLKPEWKGKMAIEQGDYDWFYTLNKYWGEEKSKAFFSKLALQDVSVRQGHTQLTEMVASGEVPLALTVYNYSPEALKAKGAPIDWFTLTPAVGRSNGIGLSNGGAHPNAALLYIDFVMSQEGQKLMRDFGLVPAHPKVDSNPPTLKNFEYVLVDAPSLVDQIQEWEKRYEEAIVKPSGLR